MADKKEGVKPTHVKPSFYAFIYEQAKDIAIRYGYNLVLHGSMNRDLDLIAVPWKKELGVVKDMLNEIAQFIGSKINEKTYEFTHRGTAYILDINRGGYFNYMKDEEYYLELLVLDI